MNYKKIVVAGGGILGSQIAFQTAYSGFAVTVLVREEDSREDLIKKFDDLKILQKERNHQIGQEVLLILISLIRKNV